MMGMYVGIWFLAIGLAGLWNAKDVTYAQDRAALRLVSAMIIVIGVGLVITVLKPKPTPPAPPATPCWQWPNECRPARI